MVVPLKDIRQKRQKVFSSVSGENTCNNICAVLKLRNQDYTTDACITTDM